MKILQKKVVAIAVFVFLFLSLASFKVSAIAPTKTVKATPTASAIATPTEMPTVAPVAATPVPQSTSEWIMTHKKIDLLILLVIAVIGYGFYRSGKKGKGSPPEETPKEEEPVAEEETKVEDETPPENSV